MDYRVYGYHASKHITKPLRGIGNIKGLELEISDCDCSEILNEMVEDNILTVPSNEEIEKDYCIAIENDSSVYKELIFRATTNRNLLKGVKKLEEYLGRNICNGHGTSCHIHINRRYLRDLDLREIDIVKSAEFLAPIMFKISGRSINSAVQWADSIIGEITDDNLYKRATKLDSPNLDIDKGRYSIINLEPYKTIELRIFSNYYNFNYNYIKMYLETTDFLIDIAKYMKGKSYIEEYDNIIEMCKEFFMKTKYKDISDRHRLYEFFLSANERKIKTIKLGIQNAKFQFRQFKNAQENFVEDERGIQILRLLRNIQNNISLNEMEIDISNYNIENIEENILNELTQSLEELEEEEE